MSAGAFVRRGFCPQGLVSVGACIRWGFYPLGLLSVGAFIRWGFYPLGLLSLGLFSAGLLSAGLYCINNNNNSQKYTIKVKKNDYTYFSLWVFLYLEQNTEPWLGREIEPKPRQILEKLQHITLIKKKKLIQNTQ